MTYVPPPSAAPTSQPSSGGGGFSIFGWHPSLPNLGGITAAKQLVSGIVGLPEMVHSFFIDPTTNLNPLNSQGTLGKLEGGIGMGVENVATSAVGALGVPGTKYNLGDQLLSPLLKDVNSEIPGHFLQQQDQNGNWSGMKPSSWSQRPGGPIAGMVQDISTVAAVAGPIAGVLGRTASAANDVAEAAAIARDAGTGTAEAAAEASARAAQAARNAEIASKFAHPYKFIGESIGDLSESAWKAAHPVATALDAAPATPAEILTKRDEEAGAAATETPSKPVMNLEEVSAQLRDLQDPQQAAANAVTQPDPMIRLYRGSDNPEAIGAQGSWWTSEPPTGRGGYANWQTMDVPRSRLQEFADTTKAEAEAGRAQPRPNIDYYIPPESKNAELFNNAKEYVPGSEPGAKEVKVPDKHLAEGQTGNPQPHESVRPEQAAAEGEQAVREGETSAREGVPESSVAKQIRERLAQPAPAWAQRVTSHLPPEINRVLGAMAVPIARHRVISLNYDLARYVQIAQRESRTSEFVTQAEQAAQQLVQQAGLSRVEASRMVGEQISAINDGSAFVAEHIKVGGDPELSQAMHDIAMRGYTGITPEVRAALGPEASAQLDEQIGNAVKAWRVESAKRFNALLANPIHGARGLEDAVLQTEDPHMTPDQVRRYNAAQSELRLEQALRGRIPEETLKNRAIAERATLLSDKATAEAQRLRAQVGVFERTAATLHDSIPIAIRPENIEAALDTMMEGILREGGVTYDVGHNLARLPHEGIVVGIANQFDMPLEDFIAGGREKLREAMLNPIDPNGDVYGPGVFAGPDARLGAWVHPGPDGRQWVSSEISMSTWGGRPLERWQAVVLGEAHGQEALWDVANNDSIELSKQPDVQNLMALYASDALNAKSEFSRFARALDKADSNIPGTPPEATSDALRLYATWDYAMSRSNPDEWKLGDYFKKANVAYALAQPRTAALLAQTVLGLSTQEGVDAALATMDARQVSDALAWYYDSHDYIESMYRGKTVTLLDGSQRDAAEVMYDLLAVTSVMASPKQNLGRSLMALSNMEDFMSSRKDAMAAADSLMKRLEKIKPEERGELNGTSLSARFMTPAVRKLTDQTSMTNQPKYNVFDIMRGKLKVGEATNEDVRALPEWWIGEGKSISAQNMPRTAVADQFDTLGIKGPAADAYRAWSSSHADISNLRDSVNELKKQAKRDGTSAKDSIAAMLDGTGYKNQAELQRAYKASAGKEAELLKDPEVARAFDQALTEFQGSHALAKLRSFRSNLSDPHNSLAVTLDSVMARMYGFSSQDWAGGGTYGAHAAEIRDAAAALSQRFGREVKPHEVQALLWVYTKQMVGRQDFGRLLAHHDYAQGALDSMEEAMKRGEPVNARSFDPLEDYWKEELGYSQKAQEQRSMRKYLLEQEKLGHLDPEQQAQLDALRPLDLRNHIKSSEVMVAKPREDVANVPNEDDTQYAYETRKAIPYDSKELSGKETQYGNYVAVRSEIQQAIARGDIPEARKLLTSYVVKQRRSIMGDVGGSFQRVGEETRAAEDDSAHIAEARLARARKVPAPRTWRSNYIAPLAARFNREHGLPAPYGINLDAQVIPARTAEVAQAVQDIMDRAREGKITPEEEAQAARAYKALQTEIDQQYEYMTKTLGLHVDYVGPDDEYGIGTLGDAPQPSSVAAAHADMVNDIRTNNRLKVRSTELAGDGPNKFMAERSPVDGLMYNDKLRAVHDFFGHSQAANDFSRHGENTAQMIHLQMMSDEAKAAAITEFRAQTAYLVDRGTFLDDQLHNLLPEEMRQPDYMVRGNTSELHQQFMGTIRGATLADPGKDGRLQMRLFQDAALDTLAHEGGHLLRQMLPADQLEQVLAHYPHITDAELTPERVASEEKFVADMMMYIRQHATEGETGPLPDVFRRIAATLEEQHAAMLDSTFRRGLQPDVAAWWQRLFHPGLDHPDQIVDPINMRRMTTAAGTETKQFRWESDAEFAQRARQYGEARARVEAARYKAQLMERAAAKADSSSRRMWAVFNNTPGVLEAKANELHAHAMDVLDKLGRELEDPKTGQVPRQFQPMWEGFLALRDQAAIDPRIAEVMDEIPSTFSAVLQKAAEAGYDIEYVPDMTWEQAQRYLFGHVQLGSGDNLNVLSGMRQKNTGALNRAGMADRSIEALAAALPAATHELYSGVLVKFVEDNWAKDLPRGAAIPDGWKAWDPARDFIVTGTDKRGEFVATQATKIIPAAVDNAISSMTKRYDHWAFHTLTKVTKPWITFNLTLSPKWYLHMFVSNVVRMIGEGVRLQDVRASILKWRDGTLDPAVYGHSVAHMMEDGGQTLLGRSVKDAMQTAGVRQAVSEVANRVKKVHDVMDEIARGAVFEKVMRTTGDRALAITRSFDGMVDYSALSPFERGMVRSVIPFYPFYKGMLKLIARFPADHPAATALLLLSGQIHMEYLQDQLGGKLPDAYLGYANIFGHIQNFSILDPFITPLHMIDIHQINSTLNPFVDIMLRDAYNAAEPGSGQPGMSPTGQKVTQVNVAAALGQQALQAPIARTIGQVATGGDVFKQNPGVVSGIGQFFGLPSTPNVAKIQATVEKTLGTLPKKGQPGYVPHTTRSRKASTKRIKTSFGRIRVRGVRKVRLPNIRG